MRVLFGYTNNIQFRGVAPFVLLYENASYSSLHYNMCYCTKYTSIDSYTLCVLCNTIVIQTYATAKQ